MPYCARVVRHWKILDWGPYSSTIFDKLRFNALSMLCQAALQCFVKLRFNALTSLLHAAWCASVLCQAAHECPCPPIPCLFSLFVTHLTSPALAQRWWRSGRTAKNNRGASHPPDASFSHALPFSLSFNNLTVLALPQLQVVEDSQGRQQSFSHPLAPVKRRSVMFAVDPEEGMEEVSPREVRYKGYVRVHTHTHMRAHERTHVHTRTHAQASRRRLSKSALDELEAKNGGVGNVHNLRTLSRNSAASFMTREAVLLNDYCSLCFWAKARLRSNEFKCFVKLVKWYNEFTKCDGLNVALAAALVKLQRAL
eukprot:scaffold1670_cov16-Tisochrysis_lutea.AAC.1